MSDDQFTKLFMYMQENFAEVREEISALRREVRSDISSVYGIVDTILKNQETEEQERLAMNNQLNQHEQWFAQLAKKTHTKLVPEQ